MKVVYVASDNDLASGAFRCFAELSERLRDDHGVQVYPVIPCEGTGTGLLREKGFAPLFFKSYNWVMPVRYSFKNILRAAQKRLFNFFYARRILRFLKRVRPDIVHINTSHAYLFAACAHKLDIPVVWHIREFLEEDQNSRFVHPAKSLRLIGSSAAVIAISDCVARKYAGCFQNMVTVYDGVHAALYAGPPRQILSSDCVRFAFTGSVSPKKGQAEIVSFLGRFQKSHPFAFSLKIAGYCGEAEREKLSGLIEENGLQNRVFYLGVLENTAALLEESDAVFVNSYAEAFGRVTAEGMLAGCLVFGADTGGTAELVRDGENGLLFGYGDYHSFEEKLLFLLSRREECRRMAARGRAEAAEKYTAERNARGVYRVYEEVLAARAETERR